MQDALENCGSRPEAPLLSQNAVIIRTAIHCFVVLLLYTLFAMIRISTLSHKRTTHTYTNITKMRKSSPGQAQKNVRGLFNLIFFQRTLKQTKNSSNQSASLVAQTVKNPLSMWETCVQSLGWEDSLETRLATHSSTLAWRIPWIEKPGRLQSMGFQTVGHH